jgi:predicted metal-dependent hydrolase
MPLEARREALAEGLAAYDRGDFFLAHELLEPAWMGARDLAERELIQGLIKLAAAFVHAVRDNPTGVAKNLRGSVARVEAGLTAGESLGIDAMTLAEAIRERVAVVDDAIRTPARTGAADAGKVLVEPIVIPRRATRADAVAASEPERA